MTVKIGMGLALQHNQSTTGQISQPTGNQFVERIVELTNQERYRHGLQPLALNAHLTTAAQAYSKEMARRDYERHRDGEGSAVGNRIDRTGYRWAVIEENVAYGQTTPEAVMLAWMQSDEARKHILHPEFREIGVGYYFLRDDTGAVNQHHYWVQTFATPK